MKKISFIIILLIMPISYAIATQDKDDAYVVEIEKIANKYSNNKMSLECKRALQVCANKGNYYCSMGLGDINLEEKNYSDAIDNFKKCSEEGDGTCDFKLGLMYTKGWGVLQSDEKAISYYKKASSLGYPPAAYNLCVIYAEKKPGRYAPYRFSVEGAKQYANYAILEYAWLKVSMALGMEHYNSKNDEKLPIANLFEAQKEDLASEGLLQQGDDMATQICSKNKFCKE
jgi:TPR repeat protein